MYIVVALKQKRECLMHVGKMCRLYLTLTESTVEIISRNTVKTSLLSKDTIKSKFQFKQEEGEEMEVDKQIDVQIPITKAKLGDWVVVEIKSIKLLIYHFVGQVQEELENDSFSVKVLKLNRVSETEFVFTWDNQAPSQVLRTDIKKILVVPTINNRGKITFPMSDSLSGYNIQK
ncbi:hypothetical protein JTE90_020255 [Oedothorax gibbosus]|uniref:Uncharacterized protein n=1 Tax=Oedothorax gibbosus TaxID=931172 RepID=A0AAV6U2A8_9ARAC|nr:hypothetical protein JTE90_020255 [Oedothorax gibbosus]